VAQQPIIYLPNFRWSLCSIAGGHFETSLDDQFGPSKGGLGEHRIQIGAVLHDQFFLVLRSSMLN